jgi:hypothetical protein
MNEEPKRQLSREEIWEQEHQTKKQIPKEEVKQRVRKNLSYEPFCRQYDELREQIAYQGTESNPLDVIARDIYERTKFAAVVSIMREKPVVFVFNGSKIEIDEDEDTIRFVGKTTGSENDRYPNDLLQKIATNMGLKFLGDTSPQESENSVSNSDITEEIREKAKQWSQIADQVKGSELGKRIGYTD